MRHTITLLILLSAEALPARVGTVRTFTSETIQGHIRFESNQVVVANPEQRLIRRVCLTNLFGLFFESEPLAAIPSLAESGSLEHGFLPEPWREETVGRPSRQGRTVVTNGLLRIHTAGTSIGSHSDSFHFVFRRVHGDSELMVRLIALERAGSEAQAGLMLRQSLDADAPGVLLAVTPARGGRVMWRTEHGDAATEASIPFLQAPCWLKLRREGRSIAAWCSKNGRRWRLLQRLDLPLREEVFVGVAVCSSRVDAPMRATLDRLQEGPSLPETTFVPLLEMQGGSLVHGPLAGANDTGILFPDPLSRRPVSTHRVANIRFQWVPDRWNRVLLTGTPGVLLRSGEFIEGEFQGIEQHHLVISSVLLGLRRFDVNHEVVAAVLRPPLRQAARFEVRDTAGSVLRGSDLALADNEVVLTDATLGVHRIPLFAVAELRLH